MIRILLVEDQAMVLGALAALLSLEEDFQIVATAGGKSEALEILNRETPDIVVTDIEMPDGNGLDLAAHIKETGLCPVLILTTFARPGYLRRALDAGVRGYLLKDAPSDQLADAIRTVHRGGRVIAPELAADLWGEPDPLTEQERRVLTHAAKGLTSSAIADAMHLAHGTVRNYLSEAIGKLGAANRIEAARIAKDKGWI